MLAFIGQLLGILAVILGFISFQMKTSRGILILQLATALVFAVHYCLIGAFTATALNLLGAVKCVVYFFRDKRGSKGWIEPIIFSVLVIVISVLTWEDWYTAVVMVALVVDTVSLALPNPQTTRMCMFVKSPLCLVYNTTVASAGGVIYECAVLSSSVVGRIRNRRSKETVENG